MRKTLIILSAVVFVLSFALPLMADEGLSAYGNARMETFMHSKSKEYSGTGYDDDDLVWLPMYYTARIGFKYKREDVSGHVELRPYHTAALGAQVRHMYGDWKTGMGTFRIGQSWTPTTFFPSSQCCGDTGMGGWGALPCARKAGLWLIRDGLKVALLEPNAAGIGTYATDTDTGMPKIEASYTFKAGPATIAPLLGLNSYDAVNATDQTVGVSSTIFGVFFKVGFGALAVSGNVYLGTNLGTYGDLGGANVNRTPTIVGTSLEDTEETGMAVALSYTMNPKMTAEFGYGMIESENDKIGPETDEASTWYIQLHYKPTKSVSIIPEIGMFDKAENMNKVKEGDETYYGAKWQINF